MANEFYLCEHCGSPVNSKGYYALGGTNVSSVRVPTSKGKYCENCRTADQRRKMDRENEDFFRKHSPQPLEDDPKGDFFRSEQAIIEERNQRQQEENEEAFD